MRKVQTIGSAMLAGALGLLPVLPPEHVHDVKDHGGHHHLVIHRHAQPHHVHQVPDAYHTALTFKDAEPILTLQAVFTAPVSVFIDAPVATIAEILEPMRERHRTQPPDFVQYRIHGPPRACSGPRSPPPDPFL